MKTNWECPAADQHCWHGFAHSSSETHAALSMQCCMCGERKDIHYAKNVVNDDIHGEYRTGNSVISERTVVNLKGIYARSIKDRGRGGFQGG